ncbi:hypothetical protein A3I99_02035 [Candidatus Kaiserbacteria bacterium RIFCSPLOWO2_02_FULL_45_11b]|uniref:Glycosyltransferase 2-like domain-containing protein n=1 Tax=Candidatus Kaiserbacteria bacterium RIFCSPLOWO2_12_FULL_45_26 TaxID=1798525 RepID=A0A1F6FHP9_9BACT|nr:MAG: hypothetical protein A2Z56_04830 [Candidatus Kaiserbacteria bacterium RIFCSPHIGHO2_12_45_16]OGG70175.1 MAG: hypothetical protein A2929_03775 [Candidatus Kaiserbacteria bacterium RIFCSPLOWO2_01_FULL_45_25]OGG81844.1 MAG: hypothetical protein A3I99_02035 [Candidatus Kaiserbacteria bacterium RIFCSPLOWO2_02_FULL_45_11b]OGG85346.1 MAG: hypothetical protein A3G90_04835 [Candidatus Kaiserbacteria bacterium RIFCSPLOWO2_12_FULL_45_26]
MNETQYSIGVVTYHARFESYFKPLIRQLVRIFPDKEIICVINGHPDRTLQINYLKKVVAFLRSFPNVRHLTYDTNQSLSKCWNQVIILSPTERILLLNDDTQVSELFRTELDAIIGNSEVFTINRSWSHFVISKTTIKKVGWFDERFPGIGQEDGDFAYRMAMQNVDLKNIDFTGIRNFVAEQENPSWSEVSPVVSGTRYSDINREFFNKKWLTPLNSPNISTFSHYCVFNGAPAPFTPIPEMETPIFYEFSVLDNTEDENFRQSFTVRSLQIHLQRVYFTLGRAVARFLRKIKLKL